MRLILGLFSLILVQAHAAEKATGCYPTNGGQSARLTIVYEKQSWHADFGSIDHCNDQLKKIGQTGRVCGCHLNPYAAGSYSGFGLMGGTHIGGGPQLIAEVNCYDVGLRGGEIKGDPVDLSQSSIANVHLTQADCTQKEAEIFEVQKNLKSNLAGESHGRSGSAATNLTPLPESAI